MDYNFILFIYILVINTLAFFLMKIDKNKARNKNMRISERTFFTIALLLGSTGVYAGMQKYRHKTKHFKFTFFIPIFIVFNIFSIFYILKYLN